ncbi:MAG: hypothetical protein Q9157_008616, partial [Trypethelium eluteriae]
MPSSQQLPHYQAERHGSNQDGIPKRTRLHITPLDPALLQAYLSASLLPQATNISYHSIATFPEKSYGYVELPTMEAEKLKKKLNGSILKGSKVRIEDAKPESRKRKTEQEAENTEGTAKSKERSSKKRKREEGVLPGVDLPEGRKVKRGWTEPEGKGRDKEKKRTRKEREKEKEREGKKEKKREKSRYTNEPELLFKTKLPPTKDYEAESKDRKKKNRKGKKDEITVHEFSKTKRHRHSSTDDRIPHNGGVSHYEDGTGWLNADGQVIEPDAKSHKRKAKRENRPETVLKVNTQSPDPKNEQSEQTRPKSSGSITSSYLQSPGTQLRGELDQALAGAQSVERKDETTLDDKADDSASGSETSNENEEESDGDAELESNADASQQENKPSPNNAIDTSIISTSQDDAKSTIERTPSQPPPASKPDTEPNTENPSTKTIHPLEALYKRPQPNPGSPKKPTPIQTDFTFFGADAADADEAGDTLGALPPVPQTPFTRQDLEFRGIRSAAPTPDTAAIGKRFDFPWGGDSEDEDEEDEDEDEEEEVEGGAGGARDEDGD